MRILATIATSAVALMGVQGVFVGLIASGWQCRQNCPNLGRKGVCQRVQVQGVYLHTPVKSQHTFHGMISSTWARKGESELL